MYIPLYIPIQPFLIQCADVQLMYNLQPPSHHVHSRSDFPHPGVHSCVPSDIYANQCTSSIRLLPSPSHVHLP